MAGDRGDRLTLQVDLSGGPILKSTICALALATGLAFSVSGHAAVTYSFLAPFASGFDLTVANDIDSDTEIGASMMTSCWSISGSCESATFYMNAAAAGLGPHPDWEAIGLRTTNGTTFYYYFEAPAFATEGVNPSVYGAGYASLKVTSIPEPSSLLLMSAGLGLGLFQVLARRRHVRVERGAETRVPAGRA
jgi:hypothetical protein